MDMERLPTEEYSAKCAEIQTLRIIFLTVWFFYQSKKCEKMIFAVDREIET